MYITSLIKIIPYTNFKTKIFKLSRNMSSSISKPLEGQIAIVTASTEGYFISI